jgi:hypothetical protein
MWCSSFVSRSNGSTVTAGVKNRHKPGVRMLQPISRLVYKIATGFQRLPQQFRRSEIIHTIPIVLLDPENVEVAVGISLLSFIQAEINVIAYVLPVNGGHV